MDERLTGASQIGFHLQVLSPELARVEPRELLVPENTERDQAWWQRQVPECSVQVVAAESFSFPGAQQPVFSHGFRVQP